MGCFMLPCKALYCVFDWEGEAVLGKLAGTEVGGNALYYYCFPKNGRCQ